MKKRIIALFLILAMTLSLTACGKTESKVTNNDGSAGTTVADKKDNNSSDAEAPAEKLKFKGFAPLNEETPYTETLFFQKTLEEANIEIELDSVIPSSLDEKRNLMLASGDYPDFFFLGGVDDEMYGAQEGILLPLNDLIDQYAPNVKRLIDERDGWDFLTCTDGNIYSLPSFGEYLFMDGCLWINKVWLDNLGLAVPTNFDELYTCLKAFQENDCNGNGDATDEIPLLSWKNPSIDQQFMVLMNYTDYAFNLEYKIITEDENNIKFLPLTDEWKEMLGYLTKLYQEGLINQDTFTLEKDVAQAMAETNKNVGAFLNNNIGDIIGRGDNFFDYVAVRPFYDKGDMNNSMGRFRFTITDKCEHPEALIAWIDKIYSEEYGNLAYLGEEGKTYKMNDDGTFSFLLGNGYGDDMLEMKKYLINSFYIPELYYKASDDTDPHDRYQRDQIRGVAAGVPTVTSNFVFTDDELNTGLPIMIDANGYFSQYTAQVLTGHDELEASWGSFQDTLTQMNAPELEKILGDVYRRALGR